MEQLFPTSIINSLRVVTRLLPYPDTLIATTYLASICPTLKLGTSLNCYPVTDFVVSLNLYIATVGDSGSKKTPLLKNLIENPLALVKAEMKARYKNEVAKFAQADHENEDIEAYYNHYYTDNDTLLNVTATDSNGGGVLDGQKIKLSHPNTMKLTVHTGGPFQKADNTLVSIAQSPGFKRQNDYFTGDFAVSYTHLTLPTTPYV